MTRLGDRSTRTSLRADDAERAARGVAALRELRQNRAAGPTGRARPGAGLGRGEILSGRALTGLVIAPGSDPANELAAGLGGLGAVSDAYRSFALASIAAGVRALSRLPSGGWPAGREQFEEARLARAAAPGETITTVLRVANRSYSDVSASPRVTPWYSLESGSPVDGFATAFEGERRFEPRSDALWRVSVRVPKKADGVGICVAAITFGPGLIPSIRIEVRLEPDRRRTGPAEPSPS
jgi:hypothetical protein